GMPGVVARPRNLDHRRTVLGAVHPRRVGLQEHLDHPQVQRPPPPPALTLVKPAGPAGAPAPPLPGALAGTYMGYQSPGLVVELDPLHHGVFDTEQPVPYLSRKHAVLLTCGFEP